MGAPTYKKYYPNYKFEWFKEEVDYCFCDGWFTYDGTDYRIQFDYDKRQIIVVLDDGSFTPVFESGTADYDEFWSMPIFGYENFEELFPHVQVYDAQYGSAH